MRYKLGVFVLNHRTKILGRFGVSVAATLLMLTAGCGSESEEQQQTWVVGPVPDGPDAPRAYTEAFVEDNPLALLRLDDLVIDHLEPTSAEDGDTCPNHDGVDCIPYVVEAPTQLELSIASDVEELGELDLIDAAGTRLVQQLPGADPGTAVLDPGSYRIELHHEFAGDPNAPEQTVFLHPDTASDGDGSQTPDEGSVARAGTADTLPTVRVTAQKNCIKCNFSGKPGALLQDENFDGLELTGSNFSGARVASTTFRGAKMADCIFLDLFGLNSVSLERGPAWDVAVVDADFTGATLSRTNWSLRAVPVSKAHFAGVFQGAKLDGSVWTGKRNAFNLLFNADFRNADLTGSVWEQQLRLLTRTPNARNPQCTFEGADLTGAKFPGEIRQDLAQCLFDKEPQSGTITTLRNADLTLANLAGTTMADADLSSATLEQTNLEGTDLSRAKLLGAKIPGVRWRGAILAQAMLAGILPPTLNGIDLTSTDFTGVDFAGLDLTRTDLSHAVLDPAPLFAGATLSDGEAQGVNLANHKFPVRFAQFEGADLTGVDLSQTELFQAQLTGVILNKARLIGANLNFADLHGAKLRGATLGIQPGKEGEAATLRGAFMTDVDLTDADLRSCDLTGAHLYGDQQQTLLVRTRLDSASFVNAICAGARFSGSLNNAVFVGAQLVNTVFNGATLTGTKFNDAYLQGADFSSATSVTGAVLSNAAVSAVPGAWTFQEQDGTPFVVSFGATKLGALATDRSVRCPNGAGGPCCASGDLTACLKDKLKPVSNGPFPPVPACVPTAPRYDNCITPAATMTLRPTTTATPGTT